jgi:hypothetical protein
METINDIVNEMIAKTSKTKEEAWYNKDDWYKLCSRIKAAHVAEYQGAYRNGYNEGVIAGRQEVRKENDMDGILKFRKEKVSPTTQSRNCDVYRDETDAQLKFLNDVWLVSADRESVLDRHKLENWTEEMLMSYARWLFFPSK